MKRPFRQLRPFGPFVSSGIDTSPRDWKEMDTDILDAPQGWLWDINDDLAHHVWQQTQNTREVGFGPNPPILLQATMGFFEDQRMVSDLNNWYFTRDPSISYNETFEWLQLSSVFQQLQDARDGKTDIIYSEDHTPHPLRSKFTSQQYTATGAMFTYEFTQWQGEEASGMTRIPVANELLDDLRSNMQDLPFEEFQMQSREYSADFGDPPVDRTTFMHPHFRPTASVELEDYKDLFDTAFNVMERSVRVER